MSKNRTTVISVSGARTLWLRDLPLAPPEALVRGRKFTHIHPDGSLHIALSPKLAREAVEKG